MKNLPPLEYSLKVHFTGIVIARRPKADVAISYLSLASAERVAAGKDRGCFGAKTPFDDAHSFDLGGVGVPHPT